MDDKNQAPPRLRIVHIISGDRWAGAEVQAFTLLTSLVKKHDVYALLMNHGELASRLKKENVNVKIFDESSLSTLEIFRSLLKTLKDIKPHIVHTHRQKENVLGSIANKLTINAPCVRTVHGSQENKPNAKGYVQFLLHGFCVRFLINKSIAVSSVLAEELKSKYANSSIVTIHNGIDTDNLALNTNFDTTPFENTINIGIVGRLDPVKRMDIFLNAAKQLVTKYPTINWAFHIFGEGKLEQSLKNLAVALKIENKTTFHGHRMDIHNCIANMRLIVFCSDHEGTPMAALESLSLGVPVIAHNVGGLSGLLSNYRHLLVDEHTADGYANKIYQEVTHQTENIAIPQKYTRETNANAVERLYVSLCV